MPASRSSSPAIATLGGSPNTLLNTRERWAVSAKPASIAAVRTSSRSAILAAACCSADHSLNRRNVSPVDALKQRNARVRSMPRYRTNSCCVTRRIGSACIARTTSKIFAGSGSVVNASLARNSSVAPGSPPTDRRASCSRPPFSATANGASKGNASPLRKTTSAPRLSNPHAVHDARPDQQHVAGDASRLHARA